MGADVVMAFDECAMQPAEQQYTREAMGADPPLGGALPAGAPQPDQALFGIVQGGVYLDLRRESARFLASLSFPAMRSGG